MAALSLPNSVLALIDRLETAGFPTYAVGGCVRDMILGLTPQDYDLCTAALPEQTEALFADYSLVLAGKKHGTIGVVTPGGVVEITTFRTEGGYGDNRHPDWVKFVPDIREDLARRDFTVNAMAYSPIRGFADPFGGQADLENRILRAVGEPDTRFKEDSLRILRGVRFAVRYRLTPETQTQQAMEELSFLMDNLARERVFDELCKLLPLVNARDLTRFGPVLAAVIPELKPMLGFDQHSPHHAFDLFTHTAYVVENVPKQLTLRWAALLHDTGKVPTFTQDENGRGHFYGHAGESAKLAEEILRRLKAPTDLREQTLQLISLHMTKLEPTKKVIRRWLSRLGRETMDQLLILQKADMISKGVDVTAELPQFPQLQTILDEIDQENACLSLKDLAVKGNDLMALGYTGKEIGTALNKLLDLVLDEQLPNEKETLLHFIKHNKEI